MSFMTSNPTKAHLDHCVFFMDRQSKAIRQGQFLVYQGTMAHYYGCPVYGGITEIIPPERIVFPGVDEITLKSDEDDEDRIVVHQIEDAPAHFRTAGLARYKERGFDYDTLSPGDPDSERPVYPDDYECDDAP
ncbi:MAG: hypothetical protein SGJ27_27190 [Candidatus Melainabacteria bacterium]|nr:hypothetical protein [Candidatus Melainabacteria bacterium]